MALTIDSTIQELLANPKSRAIVDKWIPGTSTNPQISMVETMSLPDVAPMSPQKLTPAAIKGIEEDLKKANIS
jgi:hypothetical protein